MKLLFVINTLEFFQSHRLPLAIAAREAGFCVHVATGPGSSGNQHINLGFAHQVLPLSRSGRNPLLELRVMWALFRLMRTVKPDLVHLVTIKPVLYGGLMARLARVPAVVVAISGLGSVFVDGRGRHAWMRRGVEWLYRLALGHRNLKVIFQNSEDRAVLLGLGAVRYENTMVIRGSGVALNEYPMCPEPDGVPVVTFAARLLKDKGVVEFVEAARILKARGVLVRFCLAGSPDPDNPTSVNEDEIREWGRQEIVEPLGHRNDIAELFARSNLVVLPSYYGEGLPKVLIEAAACGRAVVTTDHPGCRDAIKPGKTGLLVPVRDAVALADAIQSLIDDPERRRKMGKAARILAEREFTIERVVAAHMQLYEELLAMRGGSCV